MLVSGNIRDFYAVDRQLDRELIYEVGSPLHNQPHGAVSDCLNFGSYAENSASEQQNTKKPAQFRRHNKIITSIERRLAVSDFLASTALSRRSPVAADRRRINPSTSQHETRVGFG